MRAKKIAVTIVLLLGLLHLVSCSKGNIIGTWQANNALETLEFRADGTLKLVYFVASNSDFKTAEGKYTIEGDQIKLEYGSIESETATFSVSGDQLTLTPVNSKKEAKYRRID